MAPADRGHFCLHVALIVDKFCFASLKLLFCVRFGKTYNSVAAIYQDIKHLLELKNNKLYLGALPYTGMLKKQLKDELCEINYCNGEMHGIYKCFYLNGTIKEISLYKNSVLDGRCISYWPCGQKQMNVSYIDGETDGLYEEWNEAGALVCRKIYFKGKLIAVKGCSFLPNTL
jgi:hypothetical protein